MSGDANCQTVLPTSFSLGRRLATSTAVKKTLRCARMCALLQMRRTYQCCASLCSPSARSPSCSQDTAAAQDSNVNQRTYFTFSAPIELPGKTLPAGTYLFKLVDSPSNRHIVQVFDKDEKQIHATILAIPAQRMEPSDEPEVRFMEAAASQPAPIKTWWFPGRTIGHEFIYPKDQAARLARAGGSGADRRDRCDHHRDDARGRAGAHVERGRNLAGRHDDHGNRGQWYGIPRADCDADVTGGGHHAAAGRDAVDDGSAEHGRRRSARWMRLWSPPTQEVTTTRTELPPSTATFLPLVALFGFGSLAGAAALRLRRK